MLMLFVTIVVIHIYSDCALGPARNGVRQCCMQTSSWCPKELQTEETPLTQKRREG